LGGKKKKKSGDRSGIKKAPWEGERVGQVLAEWEWVRRSGGVGYINF